MSYVYYLDEIDDEFVYEHSRWVCKCRVSAGELGRI
jgi:hypothetical protein